MKIIAALVAALWLVSGSALAAEASAYTAAVQSAVDAYRVAFTNSLYLVAPTTAEVVSAKAKKQMAKPHRKVNFEKFAFGLAGVNIVACPDDFKASWKAYALALATSDKATLADLAALAAESMEAVAEAGSGVLAVRSAGEAGAAVGDAAKIAGKAQSVKQSRSRAFLQLKLCAASYGVTNYSVTAPIIQRLPAKAEATQAE